MESGVAGLDGEIERELIHISDQLRLGNWLKFIDWNVVSGVSTNSSYKM